MNIADIFMNIVTTPVDLTQLMLQVLVDGLIPRQELIQPRDGFLMIITVTTHFLTYIIY